jgi:hypothetical protein
MVLPGILSIVIALHAVGCGGEKSQLDRKPVYGKILGAEGKNGVVTFTPINSSIGPAAMSNFEAGTYQFKKANGPVPGEYNVSIDLEASMSAADMPRHLKGSKPPSVVYETVEKMINAAVPAEGSFEIDIDITR